MIQNGAGEDNGYSNVHVYNLHVQTANGSELATAGGWIGQVYYAKSAIDNYFVNVYVDGKRWANRDSILDMIRNEESVMVKTGQTGGIDLFFGNGYQGKIPPLGSTILVEYLLTDGEEGNIQTQTTQKAENWKFETKGYSLNSQEIDLNKKDFDYELEIKNLKEENFIQKENGKYSCNSWAT